MQHGSKLKEKKVIHKLDQAQSILSKVVSKPKQVILSGEHPLPSAVTTNPQKESMPDQLSEFSFSVLPLAHFTSSPMKSSLTSTTNISSGNKPSGLTKHSKTMNNLTARDEYFSASSQRTIPQQKEIPIKKHQEQSEVVKKPSIEVPSLQFDKLKKTKKAAFEGSFENLGLSMLHSSTKLSNDEDTLSFTTKGFTDRDKGGSLQRIRFNSRHGVKTAGSGLFTDRSEFTNTYNNYSNSDRPNITAGSGLKKHQNFLQQNKGILKQSPSKPTQVSFAAATMTSIGGSAKNQLKHTPTQTNIVIHPTTHPSQDKVKKLIKKNTSTFMNPVNQIDLTIFGERRVSEFSPFIKKFDSKAGETPKNFDSFFTQQKKKSAYFKGFFDENQITITQMNMEESQALFSPNFEDDLMFPIKEATNTRKESIVLDPPAPAPVAAAAATSVLTSPTNRFGAKTATPLNQRGCYFPSQPTTFPSERLLQKAMNSETLVLDKSIKIIGEDSQTFFGSESSGGVSNSSLKQMSSNSFGITQVVINQPSAGTLQNQQYRGLSQYAAAATTATTIFGVEEKKEGGTLAQRKLKEQQRSNHPLSSSKFKETLAFWQKLKKETYNMAIEDDDDNGMGATRELNRSAYRLKRNGFDQKAIQCLVQLVERITDVCERASYDERGYSNVYNQLELMISNVRVFQSISQFFVVRLLTLSGKFSFKCGNVYYAMKAFLSAKKISWKMQDLKRKLRLHRYIGQCFKLLRDFGKAKSQFIKMLKLSWVTDNKEAELKAYDELGIIFYYNCELLISQRLHLRLCLNVTEHAKSSIRKTVVDTFNKMLREEEEKNLMGIDSPISKGLKKGKNTEALQREARRKDKQDKKKIEESQRRSITASSQPPIEFSLLDFANPQKQQEQQNGSNGGGAAVVERENNIGGIDVEFSDSSEEETDFFVRQLAQQDILREEKAEKERKEEQRAEKTLKNVRFKYSKMAQEQEIQKNDFMVQNKLKQSERVQNMTNNSSGGQSANQQIFLTHLSRNRRENDYKEDLFREHQYFHLKEYQNQLLNPTEQAILSIDVIRHDKPQQMHSDRHNKRLSAKVSAISSVSDKSSRRVSTDLNNQSHTSQKLMTVNKFPVAYNTFRKLGDDLVKVKQQILLLLNNIEKYEANYMNPNAIKRKNALFFL